MHTHFSYWSYPTNIVSGVGCRSMALTCLQELRASSPMLVCDPGLMELEIVRELIQALKEPFKDLTIFSEFESNPTSTSVDKGSALCAAAHHDCIIALGGGSALDVGKAIAFMAYQKGEIFDYEDIGDQWQNADADKILPCIALPTTAGTGSEVGRASVITDAHNNKKLLIFHPNMMPKKVLLDAELTSQLPKHITAATGMDALAHNLESYFSPTLHPMAQGIALEGIALIKKHLPIVMKDPANECSRQSMLIASMMGATAFQKGLGAMHALAHPLGARFNSHHGLLNAILMPYVLQANQSAIQEKARPLCHYLEIDSGLDGLLKWILSLRTLCGIPNSLSEIGIHDAAADWIADQAVKDPSAATNPIAFTKEQYRVILTSAIHGELASMTIA